MTTNYKKILFIAALMLFQIALCNAVYAQKPIDNKSAEVAARVFYKKYLPLFGVMVKIFQTKNCLLFPPFVVCNSISNSIGLL